MLRVFQNRMQELSSGMTGRSRSLIRMVSIVFIITCTHQSICNAELLGTYDFGLVKASYNSNDEARGSVSASVGYKVDAEIWVTALTNVFKITSLTAGDDFKNMVDLLTNGIDENIDHQVEFTKVDKTRTKTFTELGMGIDFKGFDISEISLSSRIQSYVRQSKSTKPKHKHSVWVESKLRVYGESHSVPEPSLGLLLGISLAGLVGAGTVRKIKQKKAVANS